MTLTASSWRARWVALELVVLEVVVTLLRCPASVPVASWAKAAPAVAYNAAVTARERSALFMWGLPVWVRVLAKTSPSRRAAGADQRPGRVRGPAASNSGFRAPPRRPRAAGAGSAGAPSAPRNAVHRRCAPRSDALAQARRVRRAPGQDVAVAGAAGRGWYRPSTRRNWVISEGSSHTATASSSHSGKPVWRGASARAIGVSAARMRASSAGGDLGGGGRIDRHHHDLLPRRAHDDAGGPRDRSGC